MDLKRGDDLRKADLCDSFGHRVIHGPDAQVRLGFQLS